jgi:hypothetical protein
MSIVRSDDLSFIDVPCSSRRGGFSFFFEKKETKKATTSQNSNNVLPLQPHLLVADIIGVLRARGLHPQLVVNFNVCG